MFIKQVKQERLVLDTWKYPIMYQCICTYTYVILDLRHSILYLQSIWTSLAIHKTIQDNHTIILWTFDTAAVYYTCSRYGQALQYTRQSHNNPNWEWGLGTRHPVTIMAQPSKMFLTRIQPVNEGHNAYKYSKSK